MKKLVLMVMLGLALGVNAEIKFEKTSWKEVVAKASREDKLIFVDLYAVWCGPCKWIEKNVFTDASVATYYNQNFINFRIDAEKEELALVEQVNITAYPTLAWFSPQGKLLYKMEGAPQPDYFLTLGKKMIKSNTAAKSTSVNLESSESVLSHLFMMGESEPQKAQELAFKYLQKDPARIKTDEGWEIARDYIYSPSYEEFKWLTTHLDSYKDREDFGDFYVALFENKMTEATEAEDIRLLDGFRPFELSVMKSLELQKYPDAFYDRYLDGIYYLTIADTEKLLPLVENLLETYHKEEPSEYADWVSNMLELPFDEVGTSLEKWAAYAAQKEPSARHIMLHAIVRYEDADYNKAIELAKKAKSISDDEEMNGYIDSFIETVRESMK